MHSLHNHLSKLFYGEDYNLLEWQQRLTTDILLLVGVILVAVVTYFVFKKILIGIITKVVTKTKNTWDDELLSSRILKWISLLIPVIIIQRSLPHVLLLDNTGVQLFVTIALNICAITAIILASMALNSLLNIIERIYQRFEVSRELPIKGMLQVVKISILIAALIFIISTLIGKSPILLFSGLGAMTAVTMLVFKDSILGLVAGIQLSANRMVARGDWIEMPKFGADGEVLEVALTTVKVKNWDKTITTIPTYALISDSFKNWRGMANSGVRRIKRSVSLDMSTVGFLDSETLAKLKNITLLKGYLAEKETELAEWNSEHADPSNNINARAL
ncbi:MAG: mechanosensitive ion channel family protein, partial [Akkermansiaceae bacterium]